MALRMAMISLVASLGLSLPSQDKIDRWMSSAQGWMDEKLAAWDAHMPRDSRSFIRFDSDESSYPSDPQVVASVKKSVEPVSDTVSNEVFAGVMAETVAAFQTVVDVESPMVESPLVATIVEPSTISEESAAALEASFRMESKVGREASIEVVSSTEALDATAYFCPGVAYELNRIAEGRDFDGTIRSSKSDSGRLSNVMRLTREAALAWVDLLQASAVVTIHH